MRLKFFFTFLLSIFINQTRTLNITNSSTTTLAPSNFSSLSSIFYKVPSSEQINQFINDADIVSLLKIVQILGQQKSLKCYDVFSYFLEINGKIHTVLISKQILALRLQATFQQAQVSISSLNKKIENLNGWQKVLQLSTNKMKLADKLQNITKLYNIYNQVDSSIDPEKAKIIGYKNQITNIENSNDNERKKLLEQELKFVKIEQNISDLEKKLQTQKKNWFQSKDRINALKNTINDNQIKIATIKNIIANSQRTIQGLKNKAVNVRISYSQAQVQVQKLRDQIQKIQQKQDQLSNQITKLQDQIREQQSKLQYYKLDSLQFQMSQLKNFLPSLESSIQNQYGECYNADGNLMKIVKLNGRVLYIFTPSNFNLYIKKIYGNVTQPAIYSSVLLSKVNYQSQQWNNLYGNPSYSLQFLALKYPIIKKTLVCTDLEKIISGQGIISRIQRYQITIETSSKTKIYSIVTQCTVFQSSSVIPKVGQKIYWKGVKIQNLNNYVQLYWATSF